MKLLFTSIALCIASALLPAQADTNLKNDCNFVLNSAQHIFPQWFPDKPVTQLIDSWCFRYYDNKEFGDIHLGINTNKDKDKEFKYQGVYVVGGPVGDKPLYIGQTDKVIPMLLSKLQDKEFCDSSDNQQTGIRNRQDGDTIYISTNGCIELPEIPNTCNLLPDTDQAGKPMKTGINLYTKFKISSFEIRGFKIPSLPGFPDPFDLLKDKIGNQKTCMIHAPYGAKYFKINTNICYNLPSAFGNLLGANSSVAWEFKSNSESKEVDNCFDTDATTIHNAVTKETWVEKNGSFELID